MFYAKECPGIGHYTEKYDLTSSRSPRADMNRDKSPKKNLGPVAKNDSPNPQSYKDADQ